LLRALRVRSRRALIDSRSLRASRRAARRFASLRASHSLRASRFAREFIFHFDKIILRFHFKQKQKQKRG